MITILSSFSVTSKQVSEVVISEKKTLFKSFSVSQQYLSQLPLSPKNAIFKSFSAELLRECDMAVNRDAMGYILRKK